MFCSKCGKEIFESAVICPHCGCATEKFQNRNSETMVTGNVASLKTLALISIITGIFMPIVAWICGGIGLYKASAFSPSTPGLNEVKRLLFVGILLGVITSTISFVAIFFGFIY